MEAEPVFENNPVIRFYSKIFPFSRNIYVVGVVSLELMYALWITIAIEITGVFPKVNPLIVIRDQLILILLVPMYARFALRLEELKTYIWEYIGDVSSVRKIYDLIYSKKGVVIGGLVLATPYSIYIFSSALRLIRESKDIAFLVYKSVTILALLNIGAAIYQIFLGLFIIYRVHKFMEMETFESDRDLIPFVELLLNGFIFIFILDFLTIFPSIVAGFKQINLLWFIFFHSLLELMALIYIILQVYFLVKKAGFRVSRLRVLSLIFSSFRAFPSGAILLLVVPLSVFILSLIL